LENGSLGRLPPFFSKTMKALAPNSLIQNRYLVVHLIGKGGMGEVYLAVDQRLGSAVALKRTFFADDEMLGGAFEREARTLARLRHPVLPKVSDHFVENGEQYLVMEHIAGDDLGKRLEAAQKPFPLSWALFWADQLLDALAYLHSHEPPIIHRDIKPQNLKLTDENHIILLDFGLSKNTTGQTKISGSSGSSGSVVGYTPHYAPMEQIRGTGTNPRSDIYSLSATLYQLMTNSVPADALTRADALLNGSPDPIRPLNELNPEVSEGVSSVILRGMEVSQEKRFTSAREMQKALRKAYSQMQEAMSAQTIAFAAPADAGVKIEQPAGDAVHGVDAARLSDSDSEPTRLRTDPGVDMPGPVNVNQEATAVYDGPIAGGVRQADVKTEVYHAGNAPFFTPNETALADVSEPEFSEPSPAVAGDWAMTMADAGNGGSVADATVANIGLDEAPETSFDETNDFTPAPYDQNDYYAAATPAVVEAQPSQAAPRVMVQPPAKKSSKAIWVVGGLAALFILTALAAGAGWFVYSNYYAAIVNEPTPTPEPTLEVTPTPQPTLEAITSTNSDTSAETNTSSDVTTVEPTPVPEIDTGSREQSPNPRQQQQVETRKNTGKTNSSPTSATAKPTPKKETDRTKILQ
jgi:hypothetical protein